MGTVPILTFFDQREKFATSATCVTKLTLAAKAAFIRKILCFEVFKILFSQLVDRMLENKSLNEHEAPSLAGECASAGLLIFRAVADPRNSGTSAKSREIPKKTRNTAKSARNKSKYM